MIKILFFIETLSGGGAEKVLRTLVNAMDQSKFDITVQTLYPDLACSQLAQGIHYIYCYPSDSKWNHRRMRLDAATGHLYASHIKGDYDIEVAYLEYGSTKIMASSTNKKAVKLAWVHCDLKNTLGNVTGFATAARKYYKKFDQVVCVSENVRQGFLDLFGDTVDTVTIHNTVDDREIMTKATLPLPEDLEKRRVTIALVGRLTPQKNILRALEAHKRLLREDGIAHDLWIIGEGEERPRLEEYIRNNYLEDSARLLGFRDNPYPMMQKADLLICSSVFEGYSTFVTEGLILGKPIVTTDVSGMRELLGDSQYGLITANEDDAFYRGLKRMLTEPGCLAYYREQACQQQNRFKREHFARKTETYFEKVLNNKQD